MMVTSRCSHRGLHLPRCLLDIHHSREETVWEISGVCGV